MEAFDKLWTWMNSWKQEGLYGGIILHCIHGTLNLSWIKATPSWTYTPLVNGFVNLYQRTNAEVWLKELNQAKDYLLSLQDKKGLLKHSSLEFSPESPGIIHNAYSVLALLTIYEVTKEEVILKKVKKLLKSLILFSWNGNFFSGTVNQDLTVAAAFAKYCSITKNKGWIKKFVLPVVSWAKSLESKEIKDAFVRGVYGNEKDYISPWYNAVMAECFIDIYYATKDMSLIEEAKKRLNFTFSKFVKDRGLVHSIQRVNSKWRDNNHIYLILPLFLPLIVAEKLNKITHFDYPKEEIEKFLFKNQCLSGFFKNSSGYGIRDFIGTMPWNAYAFEYFSREQTPKLLDFKEITLSEVDCTFKEEEEFAFLSNPNYKIEFNKKTGEIKKRVINPEGEVKLDKSITDTQKTPNPLLKQGDIVSFGLLNLFDIQNDSFVRHPKRKLRTLVRRRCHFDFNLLNFYMKKPFFNLGFGVCDRNGNFVLPKKQKDTSLSIFYPNKSISFEYRNNNIFITSFNIKPYHTKKALIYYKIAKIFFPWVSSKLFSVLKSTISKRIRNLK